MRISLAIALGAAPLLSVASQGTDTASRRESGPVSAAIRVDTSRAPRDNIYASAALRTLIAFCARNTASTPPALKGYRSVVESEIALMLRSNAAGPGVATERLLQVEQVQSALSWRADGVVEQRIIGHRMQSATASLSALTYFQRPWLVPALYGYDLPIILGSGGRVDAGTDRGRDSAADTAAGNARTGDTLAHVVHPFSPERERVYTFSGGDTVAVLHAGSHTVTVVRIMVAMQAVRLRRALLFRGEVDVDADRGQIVRMRGQFVVAEPRGSLFRRALATAVETVAFAELENAEFDGQFWLPTYQRLEGQARTPLSTDFRPIVRVVSRFREHAVDATMSVAASEGTLRPDNASRAAAALDGVRAQLTFATRDSLNAFSAWHLALGAATSTDVAALDFDDVAPDAWRSTGTPRFDWRAERVSDVYRYNRVEGAFVGVAAELNLRDIAPGTTIGANGGVAWAEETARGALWARSIRGPWTMTGRYERALANTNDFRPLLDYEQSLSAMLFTADDYDYIDRHAATLSAARALSVRGRPLWYLAIGAASDRAEHTRIPNGILHFDSAFRVNRPITPGRYVHYGTGIELHPNVSGEFLEPGVGAGLWLDGAAGALRWQRVESRVTLRQSHGAWSYGGRIHAIALFTSQELPQQLVEFGENEGLNGYGYKEFGGDRAMLARAGVAYQLPFLRAPIRTRLTNRSTVLLPGLAPTLSLSMQSGWAGVATATTRDALSRFGMRTDPRTGQTLLATRPTDSARTTVSASLRLFGTLAIGVARPVDHLSPHQRWRFSLGVGQPF